MVYIVPTHLLLLSFIYSISLILLAMCIILVFYYVIVTETKYIIYDTKDNICFIYLYMYIKYTICLYVHNACAIYTFLISKKVI